MSLYYRSEARKRWYDQGRRDYHLTSAAALQYARDRQTLFWSGLEWYALPDDETAGELVAYVGTDKLGIVDSLGGVDVDYVISDHGNVIYDECNPHLVGIVADMMREADPDGP